MNGITIVGSYNVGLFLKGSKLPDIGETVIADEFLESGANLRLSNQDLGPLRQGVSQLGYRRVSTRE